MSQLLEGALNGSRSSADHPRIPQSPQELAKEARASVEAGAQIVHLHPYDLADAHVFVQSGLAARCVRVLVEPMDSDPKAAIAHAAAMEDVLLAADIFLEQVHHGDGVASRAASARAVSRGYGIRTGLEDTMILPDGRPAADNAALERVAAALLGAHSST